ncbi:TonB-dependent receptor [Aquipluma nitroreducens]|uniref:TonB-dependent receptor n=1 Tax=Aquipluma nitroreducens TaxID=2010828 RepID=UPI00296F9BA4|nr:TonB-dependent receptor [Aquipluma nitroreducens]
MKLTSFLILVFVISVNASVYSQSTKLSINLKNGTLVEALKQIESQSEYYFYYNNDEIKSLEGVSINVDKKEIKEVLEKLLNGTNLEYKIIDRYIALKRKNENGSEPAIQQQKSITGKVVDSGGNPLPGVTVVVKGTTNGTITDIDGNYSIGKIADSSTLQFSFVGMKSQEVVIGNQKSINVTLLDETIGIEEVVAIGYGTVKKSDLAGAISQVKSADMENRTIVRAEQALQGKTAGVQVIQTSGAPGSNPTIRVRGFSSNSSSDPLYVVDGLRTSDIGSIDPNNIESMEVLKDAASAAIYGAQAGNGVVLITTKKGKKGEGKISYDFQYVTNKLARIPKVMNAQEYVNYMTEANFITPAEISALWDGKTDTNWADVAFENSIMQKHNLSFMGGNDRGSYNLSLSYLDQNGIVKGDDDVYNRVTAMANADYNINSWLKVGTNNIVERWKSKSVTENSEYGSLLASVLTMDPLTQPYFDANNLPSYMQDLINSGKTLLKDEDGRYYGLSQIYKSDNVHPLLMRDRADAKNEGASVMGTIYAEMKPIKNLTITSKLGYRGAFTGSYHFNYIYYANDVTKNDNIEVGRTNANSIYYQWENFANYVYTLGKHNLTTMLGTSYSEPYSTTVTATGNAILKDDALYRDLNYLTATATKTVAGGYSNVGRQFSYFGRFIYNYADKYVLQGSLRRDASDLSILPIESRWGTFPALSAGYTISNEDFFPKNTPINTMKLRASWGQNGSTGPLGGFAYRASIGTIGSYPYSDAIDYQIGSAPSTLSNPQLKWETSEQLDFGVDIRAFKNRMTFGFDYYEKKTKDLLVSITPPYETGVASTAVNAGNVTNKGLEFELNWSEKIRDFSYSIHGNLATLKNSVTYLDPSISRINGASFHTQQGITVFEQGYPVWYMRGYKLLDISDATGDPIFQDTNNDGAITDDDKVMLGSGIPDFTYGLTLNAAYKSFDITVFGTGSYGNDVYNCLTRIDRPRGNKLEIFYTDRWTPTNTTASKPRPNANGEDKYWISSDAVMDGSFFKIKQIQLGYTLPKTLCKKMYISSLRVYSSVEDAFVFTSYPGFDPEASAGSTTLLGVDKGAYPNSMKVLFGINVTF